MTHEPVTDYEMDMAEEADGLLRIADDDLPGGLAGLDVSAFGRIVLTGMGGSDCATIPFELRLARAGLPVWRLLTTRLLDMQALVTGDTLLIVTSQSGRSGEIVALLERLKTRPKAIIGVTDDQSSPLAAAADHVVLLRSGPEATVATKSFANTLAAFHRIAGLLLDQREREAVAEIRAAAHALQRQIDEGTSGVDMLARHIAALGNARLALIGSGADAATALTGAMVLKEAAKVAAEGYVGGAFRHGPLELAGPKLTAIMFGSGAPDEPSQNALARDIAATGSTVATVGPAAYGPSALIPIAGSTELERILLGMHVVQSLSVALARATGFVPGAFLYGKKITEEI